MSRNLVSKQAASYAIAGLLLSMLVMFIAFDLDAVRREAFLRNESTCSAVAVGACFSDAASAIRQVQAILIAPAD